MLRGLWRLTWLETKIFVREPLGVIGTVGVPILVFVVLGRLLGPQMRTVSADVPRFISIDLPVFASLLIAANAVLSLVAIMAIYREGGILKRLRATPTPTGPPGDLTERELDVLRLIALGHTNNEIAEQLYLSVRTVETHRAHIMQKLGLSTRAELVRYALDNDLIDR